MKTKLIIALIAAVSATAFTPAFASGYGPAPAYRGSADAPASQRGPGAQLELAGNNAAVSQASYGGVAQGHSETGSRATPMAGDSLFAHH